MCESRIIMINASAPFYIPCTDAASDADWIWLPELIPRVLQIPQSLGELLVPLGYCSCGVPYMRERSIVRYLLQEGRENRSLHALGTAVAAYLNCPSTALKFESTFNHLFQEHPVVVEFSFCSSKCMHAHSHVTHVQWCCSTPLLMFTRFWPVIYMCMVSLVIQYYNYTAVQFFLKTCMVLWSMNASVTWLKFYTFTCMCEGTHTASLP